MVNGKPYIPCIRIRHGILSLPHHIKFCEPVDPRRFFRGNSSNHRPRLGECPEDPARRGSRTPAPGICRRWKVFGNLFGNRLLRQGLKNMCVCIYIYYVYILYYVYIYLSLRVAISSKILVKNDSEFWSAAEKSFVKDGWINGWFSIGQTLPPRNRQDTKSVYAWLQ